MLYKDRLKELREEKGLVQKDLADILGFARGLYSQYETEYSVIPLKHLINACDYFKVSLDYIFNFCEDRIYENLNTKLNLKIIGERLKEFRKENKLTQVEIASFLHIDQPTWSAYERGKNLIGTPFLYMICKKYNVSADYLLGRTNEPKYLDN